MRPNATATSTIFQRNKIPPRNVGAPRFFVREHGNSIPHHVHRGNCKTAEYISRQVREVREVVFLGRFANLAYFA